MIVSHSAVCGTTEKNDALVRVNPLQKGREIQFVKIPHLRFLERETACVEKLLDNEKVDAIRVEIEDYGALEFVLEARLRGALILASMETEDISC